MPAPKISAVRESLEAEKLQAEIRNTIALAERNELALGNERRIRDRRSAAPEEHRVFTFYDGVTGDSCYGAMLTLAEWSRESPGCDLTIVLTSGGGSVTDGLALYDFLTHLRVQGHHITIIALGMAASMAGVLLQAGDRRVIGSNAFLLIHEASAATYGKTTDMQEQLAFVGRLQGKCLDILSSRSNLTRQVISRKWKKMDWWLDGQEAVGAGFADEVLDTPPPC